MRAFDGKELGERENEKFKVTLLVDDEELTAFPFKLADLNDSDNNVDLCLKEKGIPISVEVERGIAVDPRGDLNPDTKINVLSRW